MSKILSWLMKQRTATAVAAIGILIPIVFGAQSDAAPQLTVLYNFENSPGGLVLGTDGSFYGTTTDGGPNGDGTIYRITSLGAITTLYSFSGPDGASPSAPMTIGPDGNFYGTTQSGGGQGADGTVFKFTTAGELTTLHAFTGPDGNHLTNSVTLGPDGKFYGTTLYGGSNGGLGTVFNISTSGEFASLYTFPGTEGVIPNGLTLGADGNFYGTTVYSSIKGGFYVPYGTIFKITPSGEYTFLYKFTGAGGQYPDDELILGTDGFLYGTTAGGGKDLHGTIFKVDYSGALTNLHSILDGEGDSPGGLLTIGADGNFYGTTTDGNGTVYEMTPKGKFTSLYSFSLLSERGTNPDGAFPNGVLQGSDGDFYGVSTFGGAYAHGTFYKLNLFATTSVSVSDNFGTQGNPAILQARVTQAAGGGVPYGGLVEFDVDGNLVGTVITNGSGIARLKYQVPVNDTVGVHSVIASYSNGSSSGSGTLTIRNASSIAVPDIIRAADAVVSIHAYLTGSPGAITAPGHIPLTFAVDGTTIGTALTDALGDATIQYPIPFGAPAGNHTITVTYGGDEQFTSGSGTGTLTVN